MNCVRVSRSIASLTVPRLMPIRSFSMERPGSVPSGAPPGRSRAPCTARARDSTGTRSRRHRPSLGCGNRPVVGRRDSAGDRPRARASPRPAPRSSVPSIQPDRRTGSSRRACRMPKASLGSRVSYRKRDGGRARRRSRAARLLLPESTPKRTSPALSSGSRCTSTCPPLATRVVFSDAVSRADHPRLSTRDLGRNRACCGLRDRGVTSVLPANQSCGSTSGRARLRAPWPLMA